MPIGVGVPWSRRSVDAGGTTVEAGIASIRDPIEIETPDALRWSATVQATSLTDISGLTATATHDTVTVRWNRQPSADFWYLGIGGAEVGGGQSKFIMDWEDGWGEPTSATHEVTFTDLPPDTEYRVLVEGPEDLYAGPAAAVEATTTVRTAVAPADYTPPLRGPQNLRATATHDTITVRWDHPRTDTEDDYWLRISGPPGRVPIGARDEFVFPPDSAHTYGRLTPGTTYRIRVTHIDITRESAEITVTTKAAPPPLRLTLTAERSECTAGTLNPATWEISGGVGPYRLTVDGASVDADAESATVTCGALPEGASEARGTITAVVTDATGATATASAAYTIVPPLPAPTGVTSYPLRTAIALRWDRVPGTGPNTHTGVRLPLPTVPRALAAHRRGDVDNDRPCRSLLELARGRLLPRRVPRGHDVRVRSGGAARHDGAGHAHRAHLERVRHGEHLSAADRRAGGRHAQHDHRDVGSAARGRTVRGVYLGAGRFHIPGSSHPTPTPRIRSYSAT